MSATELDKVRHPLQTNPVIEPISNRLPNTPFTVSLISFLLGCVFSAAAILALSGGVSRYLTPQLGAFIAAWAAFHWGEFAVTALCNLEKCSVDSFLLDNGTTYHLANLAALSEYMITLYWEPSWKQFPYVSTIGFLIVLFGQSLRSAAMIHASTNFSHAVAYTKRDSHVLVSTGVYGWFRHPSYAGFYYWALGTQILLQNPITFVAYAYMLWRFFYNRTRYEERALVKFFGKEYEDYRRRVGTKIPFVP